MNFVFDLLIAFAEHAEKIIVHRMPTIELLLPWYCLYFDDKFEKQPFPFNGYGILI